MIDVLRLDGWKGDKLFFEYEDSCLKCLEEKAAKIHNDITYLNEHISIGYYSLETVITGSEKDNKYELIIKVMYYGDRSKHEYKENTHRQKIDI